MGITIRFRIESYPITHLLQFELSYLVNVSTWFLRHFGCLCGCKSVFYLLDWFIALDSLSILRSFVHERANKTIETVYVRECI